MCKSCDFPIAVADDPIFIGAETRSQKSIVLERRASILRGVLAHTHITVVGPADNIRIADGNGREITARTPDLIWAAVEALLEEPFDPLDESVLALGERV